MSATTPRLRDTQSDRHGMSLPDGKTCGDCAYFKDWCRKVYDSGEKDEVCDFAPSRFRSVDADGKVMQTTKEKT